MKRIAVSAAAVLFCASAWADPVTSAYDEAFASARVALKLHKDCEVSLEREDMNPCQSAKNAYTLYKQKADIFLASVKPEDLFLHVTHKQMEDLTLVNNQLGQSMDYISAYLEAKKK